MDRKIFLLALLTTACGGAAVSNQTSVAPASSGSVRHEGVWPEEGPMKWAPRPTEAAITPNDLRTRLYQISDDSMQGRKIGELGNYKTTSYIASEFKRLGLKPAGDNGTYFQALEYGAMAFDPSASALTAGGAPLKVKTDFVPVGASAPNQVVAMAALQNTPTVFAGRWGDTATALDASMLRGKVAVFLAPIVVRAAPAAGRAGGRGGAPGANGNFISVRDTRAASAGAAAVLVASLDEMPANAVEAAFAGRNAVQNNGRPTAVAGANDMAAASISTDAAARLFGKPLTSVAVGTAGAPVTASWKQVYKPSAYAARNVIGILPGSDPARAGEYVLVGAHNDHNGVNATAVDHDSLRAFNRIMRPQGANDRPGAPTAAQQHQIDSMIAYARSIRAPRRDSIMNGADDDGSGTVVMMEIAEKFATEHPARSIIFISHVGEEAGLLGSKWFVDHPTVPLDSIVAAHNMDMVGKGRVTDVKFGGPNSVQTLGSRRLSREFGDIIDSVNAIIKNPMAIDRSWDVPANPLNRFCRSDQVNYVHHNVPVTYFSLGYAEDYHQPTDEPQYIDYDHAARLGNFIHDVMTAIANRADKPAIAGPDPAYPSCG